MSKPKDYISAFKRTSNLSFVKMILKLQPKTKGLDLFSSYILFPQRRPCDDTLGKNNLRMYAYIMKGQKESYPESITCSAYTDHVVIPEGIVSLSFHSLHVHMKA